MQAGLSTRTSAPIRRGSTGLKVSADLCSRVNRCRLAEVSGTAEPGSGADVIPLFSLMLLGFKSAHAESRRFKNKALRSLGVTFLRANVRFWGYGLPINEGQNSGLVHEQSCANRGVEDILTPLWTASRAFQMPFMPHSLRPQSKPGNLSTSVRHSLKLLGWERSQERRKKTFKRIYQALMDTEAEKALLI